MPDFHELLIRFGLDAVAKDVKPKYFPGKAPRSTRKKARQEAALACKIRKAMRKRANKS